MYSSQLPSIDIEKYGGKQVALLNGDIVACGETLEEVMSQVKQALPELPLRDVEFLIVPRTLSVIYYANRFSIRNIVL